MKPVFPFCYMKALERHFINFYAMLCSKFMLFDKKFKKH